MTLGHRPPQFPMATAVLSLLALASPAVAASALRGSAEAAATATNSSLRSSAEAAATATNSSLQANSQWIGIDVEVNGEGGGIWIPPLVPSYDPFWDDDACLYSPWLSHCAGPRDFPGSSWGSCANRCDLAARADCRCDPGCEWDGSCCWDYWRTCSAQPVERDSCEANGCGGYDKSRSCQCNSKCKRYGNCCSDYKEECAAEDKHVMTLYHQTSMDIARLILKKGFKPGRRGWCGGGIYFAKTPKATDKKAIGPDSHKGAIIEARVNVGRVKHMSKTCDKKMTGSRLWRQGYDSITFNPGDGAEFVVYSNHRVLSTKLYRR